MIATNLWSFLWRRPSHFYERHRPEATTLHQVVQENLETLYGAGAADARGRETLLKYVLRPPIAQERITRGPDGLVRIALKKAFSDGTIAVDLDPLSLLTRLCAAVPPPTGTPCGTSVFWLRRANSDHASCRRRKRRLPPRASRVSTTRRPRGSQDAIGRGPSS